VGLNGTQGALYVFVRPAGGWESTSIPSAELTAFDGATNDLLGSSAGIWGDTVVGGAPVHTVGINGNQGGAYAFERPAPAITITSPGDGAGYTQGQAVPAAFTCADQPGGSGLASCTASSANGAPIDTGTLGTHSFTVTATDNAGRQRTQSINYTVTPQPPSLPSPPSCQTACQAPPIVSRLAQSHRRWRVGSRLASTSRKPRAPIGTTFSFTLDQDAGVTLTFSQRRCVAPINAKRRRPMCTRTVARGSMSFAGHAGANRISFQGRISRTRKLRPGVYALTIVATNTAGQRSRPEALWFTIVSPS
jgi:hypothetical protein